MAEQTMKPATAAQKLGVHLPATPAEFQDGEVTRTQLNELLSSPPEWLVELRKNGPHPRHLVSGKLGISNTGLLRGGITEALTTAEITALLQDPPAWLVQERATQAAVREEKLRVKDRDAAKAKEAARSAQPRSSRQ